LARGFASAVARLAQRDVIDLAVPIGGAREAAIGRDEDRFRQSRDDRIERVVRTEPVADCKRFSDEGTDGDSAHADSPENKQRLLALLRVDNLAPDEAAHSRKDLGVEEHGHQSRLAIQTPLYVHGEGPSKNELRSG